MTYREELEELRLEILSFSEKYSIKCVENAALEEKLHLANGKLRHFQQMQQLELRWEQRREEKPHCFTILQFFPPSEINNFVRI